MIKFIEGQDRSQGTLFPERLDDYVQEDSPVRVIDVFIDDLDISGLGFRTELAATGRPRYHPKMMLKLYVYGYLNRVQSSRRLEASSHMDRHPSASHIRLTWTGTHRRSHMDRHPSASHTSHMDTARPA